MMMMMMMMIIIIMMIMMMVVVHEGMRYLAIKLTHQLQVHLGWLLSLVT